MTRSIQFVEVGPRDGLQNEKTLISTEDKLELVRRAIAAGARRIEVTSFVNPKKVPQMADAEAVCAGLPEDARVSYIGLVMNLRGAERALATGRIDQLGAVCVASDGLAISNQGQTSDESVETAKAIIAAAQAAGRSGQATIAAAFGCPFDGEVSEDRVVAMAIAAGRGRPGRDRPGRHHRRGRPGACCPAGRACPPSDQSDSGPRAFPQHPQYRPRQCLGGGRGRGQRGRCLARRAWRLPLRAGRGGQCAERGRGLYAGARRGGDGNGSGTDDRGEPLAGKR